MQKHVVDGGRAAEADTGVCRVRAQLGRRKVTTLVGHADLVHFQQQLAKATKSTVATTLPKKVSARDQGSKAEQAQGIKRKAKE